MSNEKLTELEHRLALAEREVENTRAQVRALQEQGRPPSRLRRDGMLGLLGLVLMFAAARTLVTEAQGTRPEVLTVKAPFQVVDAAGNVILRADTGGLTIGDVASGGKVNLKAAPSVGGKAVLQLNTRLYVGDPGSGGVDLGVGPSGNGYLVLRTAAGTNSINVGNLHGGGMGVYVTGPDGKTVEASLALLPSSNKGALHIGDAKSGGVHIGIGPSGAGYMTVLRADGNRGIGVGQSEARPMALTVFGDKEKELASLGSDDKGGRLELATPTGAAVAGLLAGDTGGRLALTGPSGGKSAVSLSVEATGGKVRVFPRGGGSAQAELTAESAGGAFTAYNNAGHAIAFFGSKETKGYLELHDADGKVMIEAGSLPTHKGYVLASPYETRGGVLGDPSVLKGGNPARVK